jgi:hypothetical protein
MCIEPGMVLPFVIASVNGAALVSGWIGPGHETVTLAEHFPDEGFALPITMMIVDQTGDAFCAKIAPMAFG